MIAQIFQYLCPTIVITYVLLNDTLKWKYEEDEI